MEGTNFPSSCAFKSFGDNKHIINAVMLRYSTEGQTKTGIIKIHLALDTENDKFEYQDIEYSDYDLQRYLEKNPSVLTKIHSIQYPGNPIELNQS
jgi:hypothetical protein